MEATFIKGRIWVLLDREGRLIEDIDTDQIFHNAHLHITDRAEMGPLAFGNLEGWKDFPQKTRPGDLVVAGRNFGAGSSRQQAVDCFMALGTAAVLAPSFSAIYFRNAVNSGFPILRVLNLASLVKDGLLRSGDEVEIEAASGTGRNATNGAGLEVAPMSRVQWEIHRAGDLFKYGKAGG